MRRTIDAVVEPVPHDILSMQVFGSVPCGPAAFNHTQLNNVTLQKAFGKGYHSAFTITGGSMQNAGITDTDLVICTHDAEPAIGSIVVARSEFNEYSCKRWNGKRLIAECDFMREIAPNCDWSYVGRITRVIKPITEVEHTYRSLKKAEERVAKLEQTVLSQAAEIAELRKMLAGK